MKVLSLVHFLLWLTLVLVGRDGGEKLRQVDGLDSQRSRHDLAIHLANSKSKT